MATKKKAGTSRKTTAKSTRKTKPARSKAPARRSVAKASPSKQKPKAKTTTKKAAPAPKKKSAALAKTVEIKAPGKAVAARKAPAAPARPAPAVKAKVAPDRERTPVRDPVKALADAAIHAVQKRLDAGPREASRPPAAPTSQAATPPPAPRAPVQGSERREHLRVPYGAWVNVVRAGRQEFCLARDISMGGLFLKANPPPALGDQVQMLLLIENESEPLTLSGIVVRRSEGEGGFGVRFTNLDGRAAARLRDLVADAAAAV